MDFDNWIVIGDVIKCYFIIKDYMVFGYNR